MRWEWVSTTPFRGITLNQEGEERVRWLTDEEEARLVATAAPWLREFILVGLDTGLRRSNLVGSSGRGCTSRARSSWCRVSS